MFQDAAELVKEELNKYKRGASIDDDEYQEMLKTMEKVVNSCVLSIISLGVKTIASIGRCRVQIDDMIETFRHIDDSGLSSLQPVSDSDDND